MIAENPRVFKKSSVIWQGRYGDGTNEVLFIPISLSAHRLVDCHSMEKIEVQPTSLHSATCSDIVLRHSDRVRLVFRPAIVDNLANRDARVNGTFIYQKKGKGDSWDKFDTVSLSSLKKGEGYQLALHSDEVLILRRELYALARLHREQGIPEAPAEFVRVQSNLAALLELNQADLHSFLSANKSDAFKVFARVIRWLSETPEIASQLAFDETELPTLNAIVSRANLRAILNLWTDNSDNPDEEFWQKELSKHSFVLSLLFAYPIVIIKGKAYVGGKEYDNRHGNIVDFLARIPGSGNAVLIEIKTPTTPLLGSEYRDDVFPRSREFAGAISQAIHYRESLMDAPTIRQGAKLSASGPRCAIVIGCRDELSEDFRKRAFERFRERLLGVTVVTFDEFFGRIKNLQTLFD